MSKRWQLLSILVFLVAGSAVVYACTPTNPPPVERKAVPPEGRAPTLEERELARSLLPEIRRQWEENPPIKGATAEDMDAFFELMRRMTLEPSGKVWVDPKELYKPRP